MGVTLSQSLEDVFCALFEISGVKGASEPVAFMASRQDISTEAMGHRREVLVCCRALAAINAVAAFDADA
jgi:hypothetical protein